MASTITNKESKVTQTVDLSPDLSFREDNPQLTADTAEKTQPPAAVIPITENKADYKELKGKLLVAFTKQAKKRLSKKKYSNMEKILTFLEVSVALVVKIYNDNQQLQDKLSLNELIDLIEEILPKLNDALLTSKIIDIKTHTNIETQLEIASSLRPFIEGFISASSTTIQIFAPKMSLLCCK